MTLLSGFVAAAALFSVLSPPRAAAQEDALSYFDAFFSSRQAGAHSDFTTVFHVTTNSAGEADHTLKDIHFDLPPGIAGNPNAMPRCRADQLVSSASSFEVYESCPRDSQVGISRITLGNAETGREVGTFLEPIFNMYPPPGDHVARLGLVAGLFPIFIEVGLRPSDYGLTAELSGLSAQETVLGASTTLWGVPASAIHDTERLTPYEAFIAGLEESPPRPSSVVPPTPFMTAPTRCGVPLQTSISVDTYQEPAHWSGKAAELPPFSGCEALRFDPVFTARPTSRRAAAPSGLETDLAIPQDETWQGNATSELRTARVVLPAGMTISPGAADGLAACSAAQAGYEPPGSSNCPDAAKLGSAEFSVPALEHPLHGSVYQRTPAAPGHLFRVWLTADEEGVRVTLPGEVHADPVTGQLTAVFDTGTSQTEGLPQVQVADIRLHFFGGSHAPLANPPTCGSYQTQYALTPWSGTQPVENEASMAVDEGCDAGGFSPLLSAGATEPFAGRYSPFVLTLKREDGEQNISGLDVTMPPGLVAKLAGVPLCPEPAASTGACPAASEVGKVTVAVGSGSSPLWVPEPGKAPTAVYLGGPYRSAPYSLVAVVPAQAGPFDLGTVVTRAGIYVDPETAQVTVRSDPLPQILEGVPLFYRTIHVSVDRPQFTLNPTSCELMSVAAHLIGSAGAVATASSPFRVGGCRELEFKPKLSLRLLGRTSRGAHPRLRAMLTMPSHDADIARAAVTLPHSEFLDQGHIRTVCTRPEFAAGKCPAAAIYGYAKAWSPLLERPLEGPVYLRSSSHELPDLVADLQGQIHVAIDGRIDTAPNGGIRNTFEAVPDAPVSKFVLEMQGGAKGLLVNSTSLCGSRASRVTAVFTAHNGRVRRLEPRLANSCRRLVPGKRQPKKARSAQAGSARLLGGGWVSRHTTP